MGAFALRSTLLALTLSVNGATVLRCARAHNTFTTQTAARHSAPRAASSPPTDFKQLAVYPLATAGEFAVIASLFKVIDTTVGVLPSFIVPPIFLFLSLRSRVFALLPAKRPPRGGFEGSATPKDVKRPSWTPPGIAFPFIWLTISGLRATSSLLVWRASGRLLCTPALLVLVLHLCVGDTWNCVTNVERRLGTSACGVLAVLASVYYAVYKYFQVAPLAGKLLAPSAVWISIASVLTWTIWKINEPREPLLPKVDGSSAPLRLPLISVFEK